MIIITGWLLIGDELTHGIYWIISIVVLLISFGSFYIIHGNNKRFFKDKGVIQRINKAFRFHDPGIYLENNEKI